MSHRQTNFHPEQELNLFANAPLSFQALKFCIYMANLSGCFHSNTGREPSTQQSFCVRCMNIVTLHTTASNARDGLGDKQPSPHRALLGSICRVTVRAGLFKKSASVANDGMQSHRESLAFNTTKQSKYDVTW
jgi:hypothetical protein